MFNESIGVVSEGMMYNPINMNIEDEQRLQDRDQREKNKKMRYEMRKIIEDKTKKESEE